jgi:hypothetical protein
MPSNTTFNWTHYVGALRPVARGLALCSATFLYTVPHDLLNA